jgi:C4-dicarboxylate transporter DctM subunit
MDRIILLVVLLGLFLSTTAIGISFIATATILYFVFTDIPLLTLAEGLFSKLDSFPLEAVLFFILLGNIMNEGNCAKYLVNFTKVIMRKMPGGLGIAGVTTCAIFGAISGSSTATVVTIGSIVFPAMVGAGYGKTFSVGLITTAGILGVIIPPSLIMIIYSVVANVSLGKLFLGGFIPGIIIAGGLSIYTAVVCKRRGYGIKAGDAENVGAASLFRAAKDAIWALILPFIVLGGIYGGVFTPTEAAVAGCMFALIIELFIYKSITVTRFIDVLKMSGITSGALMFTLVGACIFCDYITLKEIPQGLSHFVLEHVRSPGLFLVWVNLLFLLLGCFIDPLSAILVVTPLLLPTIEALNIDPIFMGVILTINLGIGYCTPPLGANLFVASLVTRESYAKIAVAVIPGIIIYLIVLLLMNLIPSIVLFLPNMFM